jgi:hypothetical protein
LLTVTLGPGCAGTDQLERRRRSAHGIFDRIPPEAWAAYDRELAAWRARTAVGDFHRAPYRYRGLQR